MSPAGNKSYGKYAFDGFWGVTFENFVGGFYLMPSAYTWTKAMVSTDGERMYATYLNESGDERTQIFENRGF